MERTVTVEKCGQCAYKLQNRTERTVTVEKCGQCAYKLQTHYVEPLNDVVIEMAVGKLKIGEATRHDQIAAELIKEKERTQGGHL